MPNQNHNKNGVLLGFVLILLAGVDVYFLPCQSSSQYVYFKSVLALAIGALSYILTGAITFEGPFLGGRVKAVSGFAVFLIVLRFTPDVVDTSNKCDPDEPYTIFVKGTDRSAIKNLHGAISLKLSDFTQSRGIDTDGRIVYDHVPKRLLKDTAHLETKIDRYWFSKNTSRSLDTILPPGSMSVVVGPDQTLCCITGILIDRKTGVKVPDATVSIDTLSFSVKKGVFSKKLPSYLQRDSIILKIEAPGYLNKTLPGYPALKTTMQIYLDRDER
ncbi:MAG: hypothetical protein JSU01_24030 [Bacteroidetes bacterium]|nr:hypothetical protein [Bacteroidota bacterium]